MLVGNSFTLWGKKRQKAVKAWSNQRQTFAGLHYSNNWGFVKPYPQLRGFSIRGSSVSKGYYNLEYPKFQLQLELQHILMFSNGYQIIGSVPSHSEKPGCFALSTAVQPAITSITSEKNISSTLLVALSTVPLELCTGFVHPGRSSPGGVVVARLCVTQRATCRCWFGESGVGFLGMKLPTWWAVMANEWVN